MKPDYRSKVFDSLPLHIQQYFDPTVARIFQSENDIIRVNNSGWIDFDRSPEKFLHYSLSLVVHNAATLHKVGGHFQLPCHGDGAKFYKAAEDTLHQLSNAEFYENLSVNLVAVDWVRTRLQNQLSSLGFVHGCVEKAAKPEKSNGSNPGWYKPLVPLLGQSRTITRITIECAPRVIVNNQGNMVGDDLIWPQPALPSFIAPKLQI